MRCRVRCRVWVESLLTSIQLPDMMPQADGGLIEQVCEQGDGKFKEGAWVKISEECSGIPSFMPNLKGMYGKLTQK
jgi:hypothetical protein